MTKIEVIHILENQQILHAWVEYTTGMTVQSVIEQSGFLTEHPELINLPVGIFSRLVSLDAVIKSGDRVEIYRALTLDPMEKRRQRAKHQR